MTHRGPDSSGIWISKDASVGLAHRRLSIIDLSSAAHQPMTNEKENIWITFNGEIYNHASLRMELECLGHRYRSHSDTESILHAYEQWGLNAMDHLDGMFAFAIWDEARQQLWIARDRMGKKPLYFAEIAGQFVFASEIKAILAHPSARRAICEEAMWHYLTFAVAPAPWTLFDGIYKLPPATHVIIPRKGSWTFAEYWRPWFPTDHPSHSFEKYAEEVYHHLQASVERRLMSDVPFGVFLSGGIDSSANVAFMSRAMDRPVDTFSVGFEEQSQAPYNEIQYARKVAALFKTNHHEILISDQHFFDFVEKLAFYQDEPLSDPVCFPLYYVAQLARQHGTIVIQVGEGSDEIFAGYEIYRNYLHRLPFWKLFQTLPSWLRQTGISVGEVFLKPRQAMHFQRAADGEPIFLSAALAFYDTEKKILRAWSIRESSASLCKQAYRWENPSLKILERTFPTATIHKLPQIEAEDDDFLKKIIFWECHQRLGELLLMRLDKMMMAHGVEGRAPFLDQQLVELAMRMPSSMKIVNGIGKAVLKKAVEPLLPHDLIGRKKIGFCGGSGNMLTPAILHFAEETVLSTLPSYDWPRSPLKQIFKEQQNGIAENSFQIWNLMNLALWFKQWF